MNPTRASSSATNAHRISRRIRPSAQEPDWTIDHPHARRVDLPGGWQMRIARAAGGVGEGRIGSGRTGVHGVKGQVDPLLMGFPRERGSAEVAADSPGTPWVIQRSPAAGGVPRPSSYEHPHGRRWVMCTPRLPPQDNHRSAGRHLPGLFAIWYTRARRLHPQPVDGAKNPAGIEPGEVRLPVGLLALPCAGS